MTDALVPEVFILILSLGLSAFFSLTETTVTSISSLKAKHLQELHGKQANVLNLWIQKPQLVLASLLLGNNLANIFASIFADELMRRYFGNSSIVLVTIVMTIVIVLFAEIIPKSYAKKNAYSIVIPVISVYRLFYFILKPFALAMSFLSHNLQRIFIKGKTREEPQITEEELEFLINFGEQEGVIPEQKHEMLSGIFELGDTMVREIMVHRIDLVALPQSTILPVAIEKFRETGLSRLPIYEEKIDNIVGLIHVKDALFYLKNNDPNNESPVSKIKREVMFVPETKHVDKLFQEMRLQKQQLAIVLDEFGGTSGVVTMEDIFEEIVGEVRDEFDNEEDVIRPTQMPHQFLVECKIHIEDFCSYFDLNMKEFLPVSPHFMFDTLGGFVIDHYGRIPKAGEKFSFQTLSIEVVEVSKRRVRRVVVRLHQDQKGPIHETSFEAKSSL